MNRFFVNILLVASLLIVSCEVKMPEDVIPPGKMEALLYDYHLVQSMSSEYASNKYKEKLYVNYVFDKHNVSKENFEHSMEWYNRYPKHLKKIYANLEERLDVEYEAMSASGVSQESGVSLDVAFLASDTAELWTGSHNRILSSTILDSHLAFSFETPADSSFIPGDSVEFSFNSLFVNEGRTDITQWAHAAILVKYENGTTDNFGLDIEQPGASLLSVKRNPDSRMESMSGFVYYNDDDTLSKAKIILSDISLKRISARCFHAPTDEKK